MSKIMFHCYSTDETINQFSVGYMINPSLNCNKVFILQVVKYLSLSFAARTMETIKYCLINKNIFVIVLIIIYDNNREKPKMIYRLLSCVVYYPIDNYVFIASK